MKSAMAMHTPDGTGMTLAPAQLYRLMAWLSPSFPVGAFSYSSGLEWAVEAGDVTDADDFATLAADGDPAWQRVLRRHLLCPKL